MAGDSGLLEYPVGVRYSCLGSKSGVHGPPRFPWVRHLDQRPLQELLLQPRMRVLGSGLLDWDWDLADCGHLWSTEVVTGTVVCPYQCFRRGQFQVEV